MYLTLPPTFNHVFLTLIPPSTSPVQIPGQVVLKVLTIESALKNQNRICAMAGKNPNWCQDCAPGMGTPYSVINATFPSIKLVAINSNDPNDALKGKLDSSFTPTLSFHASFLTFIYPLSASRTMH